MVMQLAAQGGPQSSARLDATFAALADPTRRAILARLAAGQASVTELAEPFRMSQPAISKHLKVLERAGLISRAAMPSAGPAGWRPSRWQTPTSGWETYRQYWESAYERLDALLEEMKADEKRRGRPNR